MARGGPDAVTGVLGVIFTTDDPTPDGKLAISARHAILTVTRNDYDGEIPDKHDASSFIVQRKETPKMNDKQRNLQHAMMSFALWGGMLVNTKNTNGAGDRVVSHPSNFVPIKLDHARG
jgi:hypothetical protein